MTQTIDQTGRPNGHPGYCACRWVRLFGFVWLVIPAVMTIVLVAFMLGAMTNNTSGGY